MCPPLSLLVVQTKPSPRRRTKQHLLSSRQRLPCVIKNNPALTKAQRAIKTYVMELPVSNTAETPVDAAQETCHPLHTRGVLRPLVYNETTREASRSITAEAPICIKANPTLTKAQRAIKNMCRLGHDGNPLDGVNLPHHPEESSTVTARSTNETIQNKHTYSRQSSLLYHQNNP
ncbi:expressed unknown protein [Seminavis robusta]|uniref:Uncharacterized protein n=1 Tax=Seminavis robusta TaxID=568900 RepID=A0A9N8EHA2_9STRA|nr:expressed unknown protein [Seminavis robusta]|eukprot:Sro1002_g229930.1 n/a (175) ;mRNA; f:39494-40018